VGARRGEVPAFYFRPDYPILDSKGIRSYQNDGLRSNTAGQKKVNTFHPLIFINCFFNEKVNGQASKCNRSRKKHKMVKGMVTGMTAITLFTHE
jgi:hypothetical protein